MEAATAVKQNNNKDTRASAAGTFFKPVVQAKTNIGQPGDQLEQEADMMADRIVPPSGAFFQNNFFKPASNVLQRKCQACEEEEKHVHRKESNPDKTHSSEELNGYINSLDGKGHSMPSHERQFFEPRFGYNFSGVKLHTDSVAAKSAQSINALAYTSGNNIVFNTGQYSFDSDSGKKLMAHELTHVVQQGQAAGTIQRQGVPAPANPSPSAPAPSAPAPSAPAPAPPVPAPRITSETVMLQPGSRTRTDVGVGEEVRVTLSTGTATTAWTATAGTFIPPAGTTGATVTWAAPDTAQAVTVSAGGVSITFTVIAPNDVHMDQAAGTPTKHTQNHADLGMQTTPFLLPDTVNFNKVINHEMNVAAAASGVYSCFGTNVGHCRATGVSVACNDIPSTTTVVAGKGTQTNGIDCVFSGDCQTRPPFAGGSISFVIPYEYKVGSGSFHPFKTINQVNSLAADGVSLTCDKAGAHVAATVSSASSGVAHC